MLLKELPKISQIYIKALILTAGKTKVILPMEGAAEEAVKAISDLSVDGSENISKK